METLNISPAKWPVRGHKHPGVDVVRRKLRTTALNSWLAPFIFQNKCEYVEKWRTRRLRSGSGTAGKRNDSFHLAAN